MFVKFREWGRGVQYPIFFNFYFELKKCEIRKTSKCGKKKPKLCQQGLKTLSARRDQSWGGGRPFILNPLSYFYVFPNSMFGKRLKLFAGPLRKEFFCGFPSAL